MILGLFGIENQLYSQMTAALTAYQRGLLWQEMEIIIESHSWSNRREQLAIGTQPKLIRLCQSPCAKGPENIVENRVERM